MLSISVEGDNIRGGSQQVTCPYPETLSELCFLLKRKLSFNLGDQNCKIVTVHYFNRTVQSWEPLVDDHMLKSLPPSGMRIRISCDTKATTSSKEAVFYEEVMDLLLSSISDKELRVTVEDAVYDARTAAMKDPCCSIVDMRSTKPFQRLVKFITGHQGLLSLNKDRILNLSCRQRSLDTSRSSFFSPTRKTGATSGLNATLNQFSRPPTPGAYTPPLYPNGSTTTVGNHISIKGSYVPERRPLNGMRHVAAVRPASAARVRYNIDPTGTLNSAHRIGGEANTMSGNSRDSPEADYHSISSSRKSALRQPSSDVEIINQSIPRDGYKGIAGINRPDSGRNIATRSLIDEHANSSDIITIYCVYTGTTSQRAKAFQTKRRNPGYDIIMSTLRKKIGCDLSLGHIDDTGDCIEILSNDELRALALSTPGPSLSLQCWAKYPGVHFADPYANRSPSREIINATDVGYNDKMYSPSRPHLSSRISNASLYTDQSRVSFSPIHDLDVSNTAWTTKQLREIFDALSINSGNASSNGGGRGIDKLEMMAYFQQCYDDMGVFDSSKKFEKLIDSNTKSKDGLISFDEFAVIMLKIAQW